MTLLKIKAGVTVSTQVIIAAAAVNAAQVLGISVDTVITSGSDGKHKKGSKHYRDEALDFRTKHLSASEKRAFATGVKRRLGTDYDVILEAEGKANEHLHVEFDPK